MPVSTSRLRYFDASALVKRYVQEVGSRKVRRLLDDGAAATSRLSEVEVASALARLVREGAVSGLDRDRAIAALTVDVAALLVVEVTSDIAARARTLLALHPLRASDAVQLASCLSVQDLGDPVPLVAFDDRLIEAARREGVRVA